MRGGVALLLLGLVGCAPAGPKAPPQGEAVGGGMTIVMRTADRSQCVKQQQTDLINVALSAPLAYASDNNGKPVTKRVSVSDEDEDDKETKRSRAHNPCWPGIQRWHGRRWSCMAR